MDTQARANIVYAHVFGLRGSSLKQARAKLEAGRTTWPAVFGTLPPLFGATAQRNDYVPTLEG